MKKSNANAMPLAITKLSQELAADIVKEVKTLKPDQTKERKLLNKERIKALGFKLIQGGKAE